MVYYNMNVFVMLKQELENKEAYYKLTTLINYALSKDDDLRKIHEDNGYKMYTFCSLYPVSKEGVYTKNTIYQFDIRTINLDFAIKLKQNITNIENEYFKVLTVNLVTNEYRPIKTLISLTPTIITTENGYKIPDDMEFVKKRIIDNAQKKYKIIYGKETKVDFINSLKKINNKPIKVPYKDIALLGNKFQIEIKEDEEAQKLAFVIFVTGLLEKNGAGFGFCKAIGERR